MIDPRDAVTIQTSAQLNYCDARARREFVGALSINLLKLEWELSRETEVLGE
jgi:hypothetical protein